MSMFLEVVRICVLNMSLSRAVQLGTPAEVSNWLLLGANPNVVFVSHDDTSSILEDAFMRPEVLKLLLIAGADAKAASFRPEPVPLLAYARARPLSFNPEPKWMRKSLLLFVLAGGSVTGKGQHNIAWAGIPKGWTLYDCAKATHPDFAVFVKRLEQLQKLRDQLSISRPLPAPLLAQQL